MPAASPAAVAKRQDVATKLARMKDKGKAIIYLDSALWRMRPIRVVWKGKKPDAHVLTMLCAIASESMAAATVLQICPTEKQKQEFVGFVLGLLHEKGEEGACLYSDSPDFCTHEVCVCEFIYVCTYVCNIVSDAYSDIVNYISFFCNEIRKMVTDAGYLLLENTSAYLPSLSPAGLFK